MNSTDLSESNVTPWCLRFVDGAMRGRSIALKAGANVIGSAGDCDILLPGKAVQARHLTLVAGDVAVALQRAGDAPVRLNDVEVQERRRGLAQGDRMNLGGLEFELDRVVATAPQAEARIDDDAAFLDSPSAAPAGVPLHSPPPKARAWPLFAGGFVLSVGVLWWALGPALARPAPGSESAQLNRVLAEYPEVQLVNAAEGRLRVGGFVESPLRLQALQQSLAPLGDKVTLRVQVVETLVDEARRFVGDPAVAVNYGGQGRLIVSGATESAAVQAKIARLGEDLHPAVLVSDKVQYKPKAADPGRDAQSLWTHWQEMLPARIVSITESADGLRHIQLANGQRYYEGALLKSGARLERITPDELVIAPQGTPP